MLIKAPLPSSYPVRLARMRALANVLSFWIYIHSIWTTLFSQTIVHSIYDTWLVRYPPGSRPIQSVQCALISGSSIQSTLFVYFRTFSSWIKTHSIYAMCSSLGLIHLVYTLCSYPETIPCSICALRSPPGFIHSICIPKN